MNFLEILSQLDEVVFDEGTPTYYKTKPLENGRYYEMKIESSDGKLNIDYKVFQDEELIDEQSICVDSEVVDGVLKKTDVYNNDNLISTIPKTPK